MGKDRKQTTTNRLDPNTERYVEGTRGIAGMGANDILNGGPLVAGVQGTPYELMQTFMNPYIDQVIGGVNDQYDMARARAGVGINQAATGVGGAFGGARHGVAEGVRMGELDRSQALDVGQLLSSGFDTAMTRGLNYGEYLRQVQNEQLRDPLMKYNAALGLRTGATGPYGTTQTNVQQGNLMSDLGGIAMIGAGLMGGGGAAQAVSGLAGVPGGAATINSGFQPPSFFNPQYTSPSGLGMSAGMPGMSGPNPLSVWR